MFKFFMLFCALLSSSSIKSQNQLRIDTTYSIDSLTVGYGLIDSGLKVGLWKYNHVVSKDKWHNFYKRDTLLSSIHFFSDLSFRLSVNLNLNGQFTSYTYDASNQLLNIYNTASDILEGPYIDFYETGQVKVHQYYVNGKLQGQEVRFHPNGSIQQIGNWHSNARLGVWERYHENGKLCSIGSYTTIKVTEENVNEVDRAFLESWLDASHLNVKEGIWLYYDENGNLIKEEEYVSGKKIK